MPPAGKGPRDQSSSSFKTGVSILLSLAPRPVHLHPRMRPLVDVRPGSSLHDGAFCLLPTPLKSCSVRWRNPIPLPLSSPCFCCLDAAGRSAALCARDKSRWRGFLLFRNLEPKFSPALETLQGRQPDVPYALSCSFVSFSFASGKFNLKQPSQSFLETKLLSAFLLSLL